MAHSRIEPFLIDLNPHDVIKVFTTVENFTNLDSAEINRADKFRDLINGLELNPLEKYLTLYYVSEYLNQKNKRSQISKKIKVLEETKETKDIEAKFRILKYVQQITETCNNKLPLYKRKAITQLKTGNNLSFSESDLKLNKYLLTPLAFSNSLKRQDAFKKKALEIFSEIFSHETISKIISNAFSAEEIEFRYIQKLDIAYENSTELNSAFHSLFKEYQKELAYLRKSLKSRINKQNERIEAIRQNHKAEWNRVQQVFKESHPEKMHGIKKELDIEQQIDILKAKQKIKDFSVTIEDLRKVANKTNIARIMFMSFPQIRDNYFELNIKRQLTIEDYLKIASRNIR